MDICSVNWQTFRDGWHTSRCAVHPLWLVALTELMSFRAHFLGLLQMQGLLLDQVASSHGCGFRASTGHC